MRAGLLAEGPSAGAQPSPQAGEGPGWTCSSGTSSEDEECSDEGLPRKRMRCADEESIDFEEEEEEEEEQEGQEDGELQPAMATPPREKSASRSPSPRGRRHRAARREGGGRYSRSPTPRRRRSASPPQQEGDALEDFLCDFADMSSQERELAWQPLNVGDLALLEELSSALCRLPVRITVMTIEEE